MNCRDAEALILAERDGGLTVEQHAGLDAHFAACPGCRRLRADLAAAMETMRTDAARIHAPDADGEWRALQARIGGQSAQPAKKRPLAPVIWFGAPLAAAAAIAFAFFIRDAPFGGRPEPSVLVAETARADYVEVADSSASTMVYVDKDSGWLVVWAVDGDTRNSG